MIIVEKSSFEKRTFLVKFVRMHINMNKNLFSNFFKKKVAVEETTISSLAPKILIKPEDIDKIQPYLDQLKDTLNTKGINNIALTGGYGSGKSTILKTFQHFNKDKYNFLNISLAAFNQKKLKENFKEIYDIKINNGKTKEVAEKEIANEFKETIINNEELERQLEISILQQIIYKVKPSNLPESRFKRIINIPNWQLWLAIPISFIIWISSIVLLFKYNFLDRLNPNEWTFKFKDIDFSAYIVFIISFLGIGFFSKIIVSLFSNSKINKVNLKGEIEIGDNSNTSILNEHYDEILYYFEKNPFNIVVIEDLDRFDNTNIFTKLRELNILLNNADTLNNKKEYKKFGIKFLYAIGDDLFDDKKERVKFFEYIIPVIPFINSSNADEQLQTLIKESGLDENILTKEFISDVTTFIDDIDMRLLTNIFHEFVIYRKTLNPEFIKKYDELFAMITYKNIDPKDFNDLNKKEGKLYNLINNKKTYIEKFIQKIDSDIESKDKEVKNIEKEAISNIKELRSIYINNLVSKLSENSTLTINISELLDDENFGNIINNELEYEKFSYNSYYGRYEKTSSKLDFKFEDIEGEVNPDFNYNKRIELIELKHNNKINLLKDEIDKLKSEKSQIENWDLKQIFNEIEVNEYLENFSNNKLLRNLILNGYINENYNDYMSLFHEVSITKEDFTFERNVKSGYNTEFNYKLNKIENLIEKIDLRYFSRETILNFDLVDFLSNNYTSYSKKYDAIISLLSNEKPNSIKFIDEFTDENRGSVDIFFINLIEEWKGFWEYIYWNSGPEKINRYLGLIIRYIDISTFINNQNSNILKAHIESDSQFLNSIQIFVNNEPDEFNEIYGLVKGQMKNYIKELDIKFEIIDNYEFIDSDLREYVYLNSHYEINETNISQILSKFWENYNENDFKQSNYSMILKSECFPLIEYINSNINSYVENIYLKLEDNKFDTEQYLLKLLNDNNLKESLKAKIIQKVETKISELKEISDLGIKSLVLINNKVVPKWSNVIEYYLLNESTINDILINFINFENSYSELSKIRLKKENEEFEKSLIKCNDISDEAYNEILNSTYFSWNSLGFESLNLEKVKNLLAKKLNTTKDNYERLKEHFPNNHIRLIEKNFSKFIENINDFETNENDILLILKSDKINIDNKFNYIKKLNENFIEKNREISKIIGEMILQKKEIIEFSFGTLKFIALNLFYDDKRIRFTNLYLEKFTNSELTQILNSFINYSNLFKKGKPTFKKADFNRTLLENLKSKQLIKNFYDDSWSDDKYRVTTNY